LQGRRARAACRVLRCMGRSSVIRRITLKRSRPTTIGIAPYRVITPFPIIPHMGNNVPYCILPVSAFPPLMRVKREVCGPIFPDYVSLHPGYAGWPKNGYYLKQTCLLCWNHSQGLPMSPLSVVSGR